MELLAEAVDALVGMDPAVLADGETIAELRRQLDRLEAVESRATARWDADRGWAASGARTAPAWLAWRLRRPIEETRRWVRTARQLRSMPATAAAWLAGEINEHHVRTLCAARRAGIEDVFDRDEAQLVANAKTLSYAHFHRTVEYWLQHADPDGSEADAQRQRDRRDAHLDQSFGGMWFGKLTFDPIAGTIVHNTIKEIERRLFEADWAEAKHRLGRDPLIGELRRTPGQRRADAFVEMAVLARCVPAGARRPAPLFTVVLGYDRFKQVCELANRSVVTPGSLLPYLTEAMIERIVADGKGRALDVGEARCFEGATRRAVEVLGEECFDRTCEVPAEDAQIDHIIEAAKGGPTRTWNGRPACGFHNRARNRGP
jgi:hypothetical protein